MNLETGFLAVMQRLGSVLPAAVQTAEVLGSSLTPGQAVGERKFAAVLNVGLQIAADAAAAAGIPLPAADALAAAIGSVVQSHVGVLKLFQGTATTQPAAAAAAVAEPAAALATVISPAPEISPAVSTDLSTPPAPGEAYREVSGVRYVWDVQSDRWASAGR